MAMETKRPFTDGIPLGFLDTKVLESAERTAVRLDDGTVKVTWEVTLPKGASLSFPPVEGNSAIQYGLYAALDLKELGTYLSVVTGNPKYAESCGVSITDFQAIADKGTPGSSEPIRTRLRDQNPQLVQFWDKGLETNGSAIAAVLEGIQNMQEKLSASADKLSELINQVSSEHAATLKKIMEDLEIASKASLGDLGPRAATGIKPYSRPIHKPKPASQVRERTKGQTDLRSLLKEKKERKEKSTRTVTLCEEEPTPPPAAAAKQECVSKPVEVSDVVMQKTAPSKFNFILKKQQDLRMKEKEAAKAIPENPISPKSKRSGGKKYTESDSSSESDEENSMDMSYVPYKDDATVAEEDVTDYSGGFVQTTEGHTILRDDPLY